MGMLPHRAQDTAFCAHPAALDATLHLLGAAAAAAAGPQPLRVPAFIDGLVYHAGSASELWPAALPSQLADGSIACSYRMAGAAGTALELDHLLSKEVQQQQQPPAVEEQVDWQVMYDLQWQAVQASQLAAGQHSQLDVVTALPGTQRTGRLSKAAAAVHAPARKGQTLGMLVRGSTATPRVLAAGLGLTQQACSTAAATVTVVSSLAGTVQSGGLRQPAGPAGLAAMLKVAAAEHPAMAFAAARCGSASVQPLQSLASSLAQVSLSQRPAAAEAAQAESLHACQNLYRASSAGHSTCCL